jgi:hypothetical protein
LAESWPCESTWQSAAHPACKKGKYGKDEENQEQNLGNSHERTGNASKAQDGRNECDDKASNG